MIEEVKNRSMAWSYREVADMISRLLPEKNRRKMKKSALLYSKLEPTTDLYTVEFSAGSSEHLCPIGPHTRTNTSSLVHLF